MIKICEICGNGFEIRKSHYDKRRTCGYRCQGILRSLTKSAENSYQWKGGRKLSSDGYVLAHSPGHPREDRSGFVREHILVAEKALGKYIPNGARVHHVNLNRADNSNSNLVVCEGDAYHFLLHRRARAYFACGHADWLKCPYCKKYDSPENMALRFGGASGIHRECENRRDRELYLLKFGHLKYPNKSKYNRVKVVNVPGSGRIGGRDERSSGVEQT